MCLFIKLEKILGNLVLKELITFEVAMATNVDVTMTSMTSIYSAVRPTKFFLAVATIKRI